MIIDTCGEEKYRQSNAGNIQLKTRYVLFYHKICSSIGKMPQKLTKAVLNKITILQEIGNSKESSLSTDIIKENPNQVSEEELKFI